MWTMLAAALAQAAVPDPAGAAYFPATFTTQPVACDFGGRPRPAPVMTDFRRQWYTRQLAAAGEPSLAARAGDRRTQTTGAVRFTWLRTFHAPVFVRVEGLAGSAPRLAARMLSGKGGYDPGTSAQRVDRPLTSAEATSLRALLATTRVLDANPVECGRLGMDGAQWIIEGVDRGRYRFVDRWSPDDGAVREVGLALVALTGWTVGPIY